MRTTLIVMAFFIMVIASAIAMAKTPSLVLGPVPHVVRWQVVGLPPGTIEGLADKIGGLTIDLQSYLPGTYYIQTRYLMDDNSTWSDWSEPRTLVLPLMIRDYPKAPAPRVRK